MNNEITLSSIPSLEPLLNHQSVLSTPIIRNKKVECSYNLQFKKFSLEKPLEATDMKSLHPIVKEMLSNESTSSENGTFVKQTQKEMFAVETDLDQETFDTKILKHRKTIRFKISSELLSSLYYGADEPHTSIYAYIFQLEEPTKLHLYTTESMKGKKSKNIIKFDIFKKVKISSVFNNFMVGIIVLTNGFGVGDKCARLHVLNGMTIFSRMIDNEKKRKQSSPPPSLYSESDEIENSSKKFKVVESNSIASSSQDSSSTSENESKFEKFMERLGRDIRCMKKMQDFQNFCKNDDRSKILLHLLNQFMGNEDSTREEDFVQTSNFNEPNISFFDCDNYFEVNNKI